MTDMPRDASGRALHVHDRVYFACDGPCGGMGNVIRVRDDDVVVEWGAGYVVIEDPVNLEVER